MASFTLTPLTPNSPATSNSQTTPASSPEDFYDARGESPTSEILPETLSSNLSKIKFTVGDSDEDVSRNRKPIKSINGHHHHHHARSQGKNSPSTPRAARTGKACLDLYNKQGAKELTDEEILLLVKEKHIPAYQLEKAVDDLERGVKIR